MGLHENAEFAFTIHCFLRHQDNPGIPLEIGKEDYWARLEHAVAYLLAHKELDDFELVDDVVEIVIDDFLRTVPKDCLSACLFHHPLG